LDELSTQVQDLVFMDLLDRLITQPQNLDSMDLLKLSPRREKRETLE
jgi:hypothetical protein